MKQLHFIFLFICLFISFGIRAQQNHFIYIQTDNKQPFYVRIDKKLYSSSAVGYLIVPKLKSGTYNFIIGFPKNEWAEQNIQTTIEDKDLGYALKNFGDKGWGFFNLQTLNVSMATSKEAKTEVAADVKTDAFSNMLSTVVNDPTIKQNDPVKEEAKKVVVPEVKKEPTPAPEPVKEKAVETPKPQEAVVVAETAKEKPVETPRQEPAAITEPVKEKAIDTPKIQAAIATEAAKEKPVETPRPQGPITPPAKEKVIEIVKSDSAVTKVPIVEKNVETPKTALAASRSVIIKKGLSKTAEGITMVYLDIDYGLLDTISIFIPTDENIAEKRPVKTDTIVKLKEEAAAEIKAPEAKTLTVKEDEKKKDTKFLEIELPNPNAGNSKNKADTAVQQVAAKSPMINSDCKNFATEDDFLKLRKKMAAADNAELMASTAKKVFKTKCFTSEQVKNLSVLFLKDADKYSFFDVAYPFVSDSHNFEILQSQLTDSYYINRFKVMIKH